MRRPFLGFAAVLAACASPASQPVSAGDASSQPSETIEKIAADYWQSALRHEPRFATAIGDRRFDRLLEDLSPNALLAHDLALRRIVERLAAVDPRTLGADDLLNRDLLSERLLSELQSRACRYELWAVDHLDGLQSSLAELPNSHTTETAERATDLIVRYQSVPRLVDQHIANLDQGLRSGLVAPESIVRRVAQQIDGIVELDPSPFLPVFDARFAADVDGKEREKLFEELVRAVRAFVDTSLVRYREFLLRVVLPEARKQAGVNALPLGAECYVAEIRRHTGLGESPRAIHEKGLMEVARIKSEMAALLPKGGAAKLAKDPAQRFKTRSEVEDNARAIVARAQAALPKAFFAPPDAQIEVKRMEAFREKEAPAAYYYRAPDDRSRPAVYYVNTYAPGDRLRYDQEALAFHEAVPGHHLQIATAQRLAHVPEFRRHLGQTAFVEGWALYAERLAKELSLYSSDASEYGRLGYELWRAQRLVVDTGLHALGWTREQAIAFMRDGATTPLIETENEVDRYIVWPGQALAYKVGELEIRRLRAKAERALGERFDLRAFHRELLGSGALPFSIVEKRIDSWIDLTSK